MPEEPLLRRLAVVRGHDHDRIGPGALGLSAPFDRPARRIRPGAGHDREAAAGALYHSRDDLDLLSFGERGGLAGRTARDHSVDAPLELEIDESVEGGPVDRLGGISAERSYEGGVSALHSERGAHPIDSLLLTRSRD